MRFQINKIGLEPVRFKNKCWNSLYMYCHNCDSELYGLWEFSYDSSAKVQKAIEKERASLGKLENCPICGGELTKDTKFRSLPYREPSRPDVDRVFQHMRKDIEKQKEQTAAQQVSELCQTMDTPVRNETDNPHTAQIKQDPGKLLTYLNQLIQLESNIYLQTKRLTCLYMQRIGNDALSRLYNCLPYKEVQDQCDAAAAEIEKLTKELSRAEQKAADPIEIPAPEKPQPPVLEKPGLFNKKKVLAANEQLTAAYEQKLMDYENACTGWKKEIEAERKERTEKVKKICADLAHAKAVLAQTERDSEQKIRDALAQPNPAAGMKALLDEQIRTEEQLLQKLFECRNKLYSLNVIFEKYRNFVVISTFAEYLSAGRCSSLEGPDGAYNLYEAESRANIIVSQLSQIVVSLDQIKENQFMIYRELQSIHENLDTLNRSMNDMVRSVHSIEMDTHDMKGYLQTVSENSSVIAHNTAVSAHYAKVNAELTNALGYMVAFK